MLIGGLPASGKSTLAAQLADAKGAVLLSSDRVRKELAGVEPEVNIEAGYREGMYSPLFTDRVYDELLRRAECALQSGEHVVVDPSWTERRYRHLAGALAEQTHTEFVQLRCDAPAAERMARLNSRGPNLSDATPAIAAAMAAAAAPWPEATLVDTTNDPQCCVADALLAWESATEAQE